MHIDTDACSCVKKSLDEALNGVANGEKSKCAVACRCRWCDFTPLTFSMDRIMQKECEAAVKHLSLHLAKK